MLTTGSSTLPTHENVGGLAPVSPDRTPAQEKQERDDLQRQLNQTTVFEYLNNTLDAIDLIERAEMLALRRVMVKSSRYYDGKQYGFVDEKAVWHDQNIIPGHDIAIIDNQYKYHIDTALMELTRARTTLEVESADPSDSDLVEAAKVAQSRIDTYRKRLLIPSFVETEGMNLLLKTIAFRYTFWDAEAGRKEKIPITERKQVGPALSVTACAICAHPVDLPENPSDVPDQPLPGWTCPNCGSNRTQQLSAPPVEVPIVTGYRELAAGEPRCVSVDPIQVGVHLGARTLAGSPWLKYKQIIMRCLIEAAHPGRVIPSTGIKALELQYQKAIERGVEGSPDYGTFDSSNGQGGQQFEPIENEQTWLEPYVYAGYTPAVAQDLFNGMRIEAGQPLIELYPNGMYIDRVTRTILDMWPEGKGQKWSASVFGIRPGGFYGSGTASLHDDQDVINMIRSLAVANANANAVPREFVNTDYLEGGRLSNDPNEVIEVTTLPTGATIQNNVYHQASAQGLAAEVYGISEDAKNAMQAKLGTFSTATGQPDLKGAMSTATGISILRDNAVGRMGPALWLQTEMDIEQAYQFLELEQAHPNAGRYRAAGGPGQNPRGDLGYTMAGVRRLLITDIRNELIITPTDNSWMPVTRGQRMQNLKEFVPYLQAPPEIQAEAADVYSINLDIGGWTAEQKEARRRLQLFAAVATFLEKQLPPGAMSQRSVVCDGCGQAVDSALPPGSPCPNCGDIRTETVNPAVEIVLSESGAPLDMLMDNHNAFIDYYKDWYSSDEGSIASPLLKMSVQRRTQQHYRATTELAKYMRGLELEASAPDAMADLITSDADNEQRMKQASAAQDAQDLRGLHQAAVMDAATQIPGGLPPPAPPSGNGVFI